MMEKHHEARAMVEKQYPGLDMWYLEVIAVHPLLQGKGYGTKAMESILDFTKRDAMVLECTVESNLPFYRRFGFEVVHEVVLDGYKMWMMLRQPDEI